MKDYKDIKLKLEELRVDILNYKNSDDEKQDLMEQFFKVKNTSPATYELLVLIYNEFHMSTKHDKKQLLQLIDKALNIKTRTIDKMLEEHKKPSNLPDKITNLLTWQNVKRLLYTWITFTLVLFVLYKIDSDSLNAVYKIESYFYSVTAELITGNSTTKEN